MAKGMIAPPASYAALFGGALADLPGARNPEVRRLREEGFERFRTIGFPGPKIEAWKYTSVAPLARLEFRLPSRQTLRSTDLAPYLIDDAGARRLVFVNGYFAADLSDPESAGSSARIASLGAALDNGFDRLAHALSEGDDERGFSALNTAFTTDGAVVHLADGASLEGPLQLLFVHLGEGDDTPAMSHPRNVIVLGDGARLDLVESHVALGGGSTLVNLVNRVVLGKGAVLRHDRLQLGDVGANLIGRTEYQVSADARLTQSLATLGGALVRNEIEATLAGSGIESTFNGLYLTRDRQHVDNMIRVDHAGPGSMSDQFYKGVLDGKARAAFAGTIMVRREAQKTNAYQANSNLLLSPDAEINTKPELEIFADDVKCSHGATAGELDEHALFYLRSRGLDPTAARGLLTFAFADEVVERFTNASAARQAKREMLRWLPHGAALEELVA